MDLLQLINHLSIGETLDFKELILALFDDVNLECIYENIKDTPK